MIPKRLLLFILGICFSMAITTNAQNNETQNTIALLKQQLATIEKEEKEELRKQLENINRLVMDGVITNAEAERLKSRAAETRVSSMNQRQEVLLKTIKYLENGGAAPSARNDNFLITDVDSYFNKSKAPSSVVRPPAPQQRVVRPPYVEEKEYQQPVQYRRRPRNPTTLDLVFATGLNNTVREGTTWNGIEEEEDYLFYSSRFFEIGFALKTGLGYRNGARLKYGISFQFNELEPTGNRYFGEVDGQTQLVEADTRLYESRFLVSNIVLPLHLEFGPTKKTYRSKGVYYSTANQFKIGLGGYVGLNLGAKNTVEYASTGRFFRFVATDELDDYDINQQIYGVSAYVGIGAFSIYGKYDLNSIFENGLEDEQFVSVGLRVDL